MPDAATKGLGGRGQVTPPVPPKTPDPGALQRTQGHVGLVFSSTQRGSIAETISQSGAARVRLPHRVLGGCPEAVLINTSGGLTDGDHMTQSVRTEAGAEAMVTTQACEKLYRRRGGGTPTVIESNLYVGPGAALYWVPQPTIFFDGAGLKRITTLNLEEQAHALVLEACIFGRAAMGEVVTRGYICDAWRIRRRGRLIHAEDFTAEGPLDQIFAAPHTLKGHTAYATLMYFAADAKDRLTQARHILDDLEGVHAASAWDEKLIVRMLCVSGQQLTSSLSRFLSVFSPVGVPRVWAY